MTWLREHGIVPWDWIIDEPGPSTCGATATPWGCTRDTIDKARINCWASGLPPLILCESRSLRGVLRNLAAE